MTKVLIGIPTYNGAHRVDWLLQSISMRTTKDIDYKIVVCDDSGKKEHQAKTISVVNKWNSHIPVETLINERNMGVAKTWNRLTRSHDSRHIIMINDDIIVSKDWLESMVYFLDNNSSFGGVSPFCHVINESDVSRLLSSPDAIVKPRNPLTRIQDSNFDLVDCPNTPPQRCMAAQGCLFGFRRELYNIIGGFDENYFAFFEESDFGTALASRGYPSYVLGYPKCWHIWSATFGTAPEINANNVFTGSKEYYIRKWNGYFDITHPRYMDKIPFQKLKWICKDKPYESLVVSDHGYYEKEN